MLGRDWNFSTLFKKIIIFRSQSLTDLSIIDWHRTFILLVNSKFLLKIFKDFRSIFPRSWDGTNRVERWPIPSKRYWMGRNICDETKNFNKQEGKSLLGGKSINLFNPSSEICSFKTIKLCKGTEKSAQIMVFYSIFRTWWSLNILCFKLWSFNI